MWLGVRCVCACLFVTYSLWFFWFDLFLLLVFGLISLRLLDCLVLFLLAKLRFGVIVCCLLVGLLLVLFCDAGLLRCLLLITVSAGLLVCVCGFGFECCCWFACGCFDYAVAVFYVLVWVVCFSSICLRYWVVGVFSFVVVLYLLL